MDVTSVEALESIIGKRPLPVLMKSIDHLDPHVVHLLRHASFAVLGFADVDGRAQALAVGGARGFALVEDAHHLCFTVPEPVRLDVRVGAALVCFLPGLGETLRINGRASIDGHTLRLTVEEAFVHCAKSILRSKLWSTTEVDVASTLAPGGGGLTDAALLDFLGRSPYVVLTSWDANGAADASPKGDPAGFLRIDARGRLAVADRPGNRRADTFHNLLEQPHMALLALVPGDDRTATLSGTASLSTDPALLASMTVQGKTPKLALLLDVETWQLSTSSAVRDSKLWEPSRHVPRDALPKMSDVFVDHVRLNKQEGLAASTVRNSVSKTAMASALEDDYEKNRY